METFIKQPIFLEYMAAPNLGTVLELEIMYGPGQFGNFGREKCAIALLGDDNPVVITSPKTGKDSYKKLSEGDMVEVRVIGHYKDGALKTEFIGLKTIDIPEGLFDYTSQPEGISSGYIGKETPIIPAANTYVEDVVQDPNPKDVFNGYHDLESQITFTVPHEDLTGSGKVKSTASENNNKGYNFKEAKTQTEQEPVYREAVTLDHEIQAIYGNEQPSQETRGQLRARWNSNNLTMNQPEIKAHASRLTWLENTLTFTPDQVNAANGNQLTSHKYGFFDDLMTSQPDRYLKDGPSTTNNT